MEFTTTTPEGNMTSKTRTDTHKPSLLDPAEYTFVAAFYQGSSEAMQRSYAADHDEYDAALARNPVFDGNHTNKTTCDHCGSAFAHGVLFFHIPSGELVHIGHICAANTVGLPSKAAAARKRAEKAQAEANEQAKRHEANAAWREANADIVAFLSQQAEAEAVYRDAPKPTTLRGAHPFVNDMIHTFAKWGNLSERQAAATRKFAAKAAEFAARDAEKKPVEKTEPTTPLVEGRREITGEIVSTKWQDSDYGTTLKMLVVESDGNKAWGTVPASIQSDEELRGKTVTLTATVSRSRDDEHFGFFSRPSNAKVAS